MLPGSQDTGAAAAALLPSSAAKKASASSAALALRLLLPAAPDAGGRWRACSLTCAVACHPAKLSAAQVWRRCWEVNCSTLSFTLSCLDNTFHSLCLHANVSVQTHVPEALQEAPGRTSFSASRCVGVRSGMAALMKRLAAATFSCVLAEFSLSHFSLSSLLTFFSYSLILSCKARHCQVIIRIMLVGLPHTSSD